MDKSAAKFSSNDFGNASITAQHPCISLFRARAANVRSFPEQLRCLNSRSRNNCDIKVPQGSSLVVDNSPSVTLSLKRRNASLEPDVQVFRKMFADCIHPRNANKPIRSTFLFP